MSWPLVSLYSTIGTGKHSNGADYFSTSTVLVSPCKGTSHPDSQRLVALTERSELHQVTLDCKRIRLGSLFVQKDLGSGGGHLKPGQLTIGLVC